jgi:hypothetical protein
MNYEYITDSNIKAVIAKINNNNIDSLAILQNPFIIKYPQIGLKEKLIQILVSQQTNINYLYDLISYLENKKELYFLKQVLNRYFICISQLSIKHLTTYKQKFMHECKWHPTIYVDVIMHIDHIIFLNQLS